MDGAKQFMKENGMTPKISFKDNDRAPRTVELYKDKVVTFKDAKTNEDKQGVEFLVKEDGEPKTFLTTSYALINALASYEPGDVVVIQQKSYKDGAVFKTTYDVHSANSAPEKEEEGVDGITTDDIPFG